MTRSMDRGTRHFGFSLLWLLCVLAIAPIARADAQEEARRHFDRALGLVDHGQFAAAIVEFNECYALKPHYAVLYDIGQAYISLGDPANAVDALQRYLEQGGHAIDGKRRAAVEAEIRVQERQTATLELRVEPEGAAIHLDGKELGVAPLRSPVRVKLGSHALTISLSGYVTVDRSLWLAADEHASVELSLTPNPPVSPAPSPASTPNAAAAPSPAAPPNVVSSAAASAAPAAPPAALASPPSAQTERPPVVTTSGSELRVAAIVTGSVGVASLAAGTALWLNARSVHGTALEQWNAGDQSGAQRSQSTALQRVEYANVGLVGGGALLGAGILLYAWDASRTHSDSAALASPAFRCELSREALSVSVQRSW